MERVRQCTTAPAVRDSLTHSLLCSCVETRQTEQHHRALRHCTVCLRTCSGFSVVAPVRKALRPLFVPLRAFPHRARLRYARALHLPGRGCLWTWSPTRRNLVEHHFSTEVVVLSGCSWDQTISTASVISTFITSRGMCAVCYCTFFLGGGGFWCPLNRRVVNCIRPSTLRLTLKIRVSTRVPRILSAREL